MTLIGPQTEKQFVLSINEEPNYVIINMVSDNFIKNTTNNNSFNLEKWISS